MGTYFSTNRVAGTTFEANVDGTASEANVTIGSTSNKANRTIVGGANGNATGSGTNGNGAGSGTASKSNTTQVLVMGTCFSTNRVAGTTSEASVDGTASEANVTIGSTSNEANRTTVGGANGNGVGSGTVIADPRRSFKGRMFVCWRFVNWSGVTVLVNDSDCKIAFFIKSPIFDADQYVFSLCAKTAILIDKGDLDQFRESCVDTTVILVSDCSDCKSLTCSPDDFKKFCKLNFKIEDDPRDGKLLLSFDGTKRRGFFQSLKKKICLKI